MTYPLAILFGIIEGLTEFLPVSSTGHMILASKMLAIPQTEFVKSFEIIIQLPAILAVGILYAQTLLKNPKRIIPIIIAFTPTAIIGGILYKLIKHMLLGNAWITVFALAIGGCILYIFDRILQKNNANGTIDSLSIRKLVTIGIWQSCSVIPGVSRSAATIIGGMANGLSRESAVEFSFLLSLPTMFAATVLDLVKTPVAFTSYEWSVLLVGSFASFVSALFAVKAFLSCVRTHSFTVFAIYRIAIALLFGYFVLLK